MEVGIKRKVMEHYASRNTKCIFGKDYLTQLDSHFLFRFLDTPNLLVLDGGCGTGRLSIPLAKMGAEVIGVDFCKESLKTAVNGTENSLEARFIVADLEYLPLKNELFDMVFFFGTFEYIDKPEELLKESFRVLKRNGKLLFSARNKTGVLHNILRIGFFKRCFNAMFGYRESTLNYAYSLLEVKSRITSSGFSVLKVKGHNLTRSIATYLLNRIGSERLSLLINIGDVFEQSFFGPYCCSHLFVVAERNV